MIIFNCLFGFMWRFQIPSFCGLSFVLGLIGHNSTSGPWQLLDGNGRRWTPHECLSPVLTLTFLAKKDSKCRDQIQ